MDLLVDVPPGMGLVTLGRCQAEFEQIFGARDLHDGLVLDAVRVRLIEIVEAVKALPAGLLGSEPALLWAQIAGTSDRLAHRSFDISHAILAATVSDDLPELDIAVRRPLQRLDDET